MLNKGSQCWILPVITTNVMTNVMTNVARTRGSWCVTRDNLLCVNAPVEL